MGTRSLQGASPYKRSAWRESLAEFFQKHPKIVNITMLLGPPHKGQISGAFYRAYQKQPTGGCANEEVVLYETHTLGDGGSRTDGGDGS